MLWIQRNRRSGVLPKMKIQKDARKLPRARRLVLPSDVQLLEFAKHVPNFSSLYTTLAMFKTSPPFLSAFSSNSTIRVKKGWIRIESMHDLILCVVAYGSQVLYYKKYIYLESGHIWFQSLILCFIRRTNWRSICRCVELKLPNIPNITGFDLVCPCHVVWALWVWPLQRNRLSEIIIVAPEVVFMIPNMHLYYFI